MYISGEFYKHIWNLFDIYCVVDRNILYSPLNNSSIIIIPVPLDNLVVDVGDLEQPTQPENHQEVNGQTVQDSLLNKRF